MIGIVDYGAGNIFSLKSALERIGVVYDMIHSNESFDNYTKIIIPGVGHAGTAMKKLESTGIIPLLKNTSKPVLGICVGLQLMTEYSEEGNSEMMGILPMKTRRFPTNGMKVPHMGWNTVKQRKDSELFSEIEDESYFYFVHSFYVEDHPLYTIGETDYGTVFSAIVQKDNYFGVQFHPEKSGKAGQQLLKNFCMRC